METAPEVPETLLANDQDEILIKKFQKNEPAFLTPEKGKRLLFGEVIKDMVPESWELTADESLRVHAEFVKQASETARGLIHREAFSQYSSKEVFHLIARIHQGINPFETVVAYYDPVIKKPDSFESQNLADQAMDMEFMDYLDADSRGVYFGNLRKRPMRMARGGGQFLIGVPGKILPDISDKFFTTIDEIVKKYQRKWQEAAVSEKDLCQQQIIMITAAAATLADIVHFKGDCNGRITEDWMVEMQRRIFGDLPHIRTWVKDNMRAKSEESLVKEGFRQEIIHGNERLKLRDNAVTPLREKIMKKFLENINSLKQGDQLNTQEFNDYSKVLEIKNKGVEKESFSDKNMINKFMDSLLESRPEVIKKIIIDYIDELAEFDLLTHEVREFVKAGIPLVQDHEDYQYTVYGPEVFNDKMPIPDFKEIQLRFNNKPLSPNR